MAVSWNQAEIAASGRIILLALTVVLAGAQIVKPGDRNYPQVNPNPQRVVELRATVPTTLDIRFSVSYSATKGECTYLAGSSG